VRNIHRTAGLLANAAGENTIALTAVPPETPVGTPRWSPDGRQIAYDSVHDDPPSLS
jgi:hypothetical protein